MNSAVRNSTHIASDTPNETERTLPSRKEIELKLFVGSSAKDIEKRCRSLGWSFLGEESQEDLYYTSNFRDFIVSEECLRIRRSGGAEQLTWKPGSSAEMRNRGQYWKPEIDIDITGQSDNVRLMFQHLDFIEYSVVRKRRRMYRVDRSSVVALDHIDGLGWFVEIETNVDSPEQGTQRNDEIVARLELGRAVPVCRPYRDLVKDRHLP